MINNSTTLVVKNSHPLQLCQLMPIALEYLYLSFDHRIEKISNKIQNDSREIHYCWRNYRHLGCIRFCDVSVVLNFGR
jgi:hypothetical protein